MDDRITERVSPGQAKRGVFKIVSPDGSEIKAHQPTEPVAPVAPVGQEELKDEKHPNHSQGWKGVKINKQRLRYSRKVSVE